MRYSRFLTFELVAALLWSTLYGLLGYTIGAEWNQLQMILERAGGLLATLLILAFIGWKVLRARGGHLARPGRMGRASWGRPGRPQSKKDVSYTRTITGVRTYVS